MSEEFPLYLSYPRLAKSRPIDPPILSGGLIFVDSGEQDNAISPNNTIGTQDSGVFKFTSDVAGTYAITIDTTLDGVYGTGDKLLLGAMIVGENSVAWDGTKTDGSTLANGKYPVNLQARLGEYHFIASDVETSGGNEAGLTIHLANDDGTVDDTRVYWDDETFLPGESILPEGKMSSTQDGHHTWGDFTRDSIGNSAYVDTYTYGLSSTYIALAQIIEGDALQTGVNAVVTAPVLSLTGDSYPISVADSDANVLNSVKETLAVVVVNSTTSEQEQYLLTETGVDTGVFEATFLTNDSPGADTNNNGTMNVQVGDTLTTSYIDQLDSLGVSVTRTVETEIDTDTDNDGIPDLVDVDDDNDGIPDTLEGSGLVDSDGDGIVDSLDLDSDNDGLFDLVESGADATTLDSNNDGRIDDTHTVGNNGLADAVETSADSGTINYNNGSVLDTDGDSVPDFRDLDTDNDGIADVIEAGGADGDNDGVIGTGIPAVDANGVSNSGVGQTAPDTDGDGQPDFQDTTDDRGGIETGINGVGQFDIWMLLTLLSLLIMYKMPSKKMLTLLMLFVAISGKTYAQEPVEQNEVPAQEDAGYEKTFYIGFGLGLSKMKPSMGNSIYSIDDGEDSGSQLYIGLDLNSSFSVELNVADLGSVTLQPSGDIDYKITSLNGLYYFYDQDRDDHIGMTSYIKAGISQMNNTASVPYTQNESNQISLGIGGEYGWKNGLAFRADIVSYDKDATLLTIGLLYRFGQHEEEPKPVILPKDDDSDGVLNPVDQCPQSVAGAVVDTLGCEVDSDGDGVVDSVDQCPTTEAGNTVDNTGCDLDTDKDGVTDSKDECPTTPLGVSVDKVGCDLDNDKDGVNNAIDQCPKTIRGAKVNASGCSIFEGKIEGVNFESGSAKLTASGRFVLDDAIEQLLKFPAVRIEVQAHTDSMGKSASNMKLSKNRAKSVVKYLQEHGVNNNRLESKGYGETQPISSNDTSEGRAQNRRVEFSVLP